MAPGRTSKGHLTDPRCADPGLVLGTPPSSAGGALSGATRGVLPENCGEGRDCRVIKEGAQREGVPKA